MMRNTHRPILLTLFAAGVALLSSACNSSVSGVDCHAVSNVQASVHADSVITTTGLIYRELTVGTGAAVQSIAECQDVQLTYQGRLLNGTVFDATAAGSTTTVTVGDGGLIPGFEQGLVGIKAGGTRQLIIPPNLAYGSSAVTNNSGVVIIPPNSTIVFDVHVVSVN